MFLVELVQKGKYYRKYGANIVEITKYDTTIFSKIIVSRYCSMIEVYIYMFCTIMFSYSTNLSVVVDELFD